MVYIKFSHEKNNLKEYYNINFKIMLRATAESLGFLKDNQIEYRKTKEYICNYIRACFGIRRVSKKQLSRMLFPRNPRFSKYAPVYLIAIYNIILQRWPKNLHTDICCVNGSGKIYSEFALDKIKDIIENFGDPNDADVQCFMDNITILNRHLPEKIGVLFANDYKGERKEINL